MKKSFLLTASEKPLLISESLDEAHGAIRQNNIGQVSPRYQVTRCLNDVIATRFSCEREMKLIGNDGSI